MTRFDLDGIDGGNPLGFLAAIGTVATGERAFGRGCARLSWNLRQGGWRPILGIQVESDIDRARLVGDLNSQLRSASNQPAFGIADDLNVPVDDFRDTARCAQTAATPIQRQYADLIAAFGSESIQSRVNGKPSGRIADTAFRTMSGSGHQHFLGTMRTFVEDTTAEHLDKALFSPWLHDDPLEKHSMRWDPVDDVRYALRWKNPSGDTERKQRGSVWGANRLAIEALVVFPTMPTGNHLATTGFIEGTRGSFWTWPIWAGEMDLDSVRSLLALADLRRPEPDRANLAARGIVEVYRCQRLTQGKFRNFGAALPP